ncbi:MAG: carbohydrate ABC transporter permease [Phycisphaerales bacterium]
MKSRTQTILCHLALCIAALLVLLPFFWLVCAGLKNAEDFFTSMFLPKGDGFLGVAWDRITLGNFAKLFSTAGFARGLLASIFLSSVTALGATLVCSMSGYALARLEFSGRRAVTWIVLGAMIIPPPLLIAPGFQVLFHLNLLDSFAGLIIPAIAPAFGVYLFRQAVMSGVPRELIEAARSDGCGELRTFFTIALPLVRPMTAAFLLITFLGVWNNYLTPQVVMQSEGKFPLSVMIAQLKNVYYQDYGLLMAGTLVSIFPVAGLFLFLQRDFVAGMTSGAVKG